jgi:hypothetical protein
MRDGEFVDFLSISNNQLRSVRQNSQNPLILQDLNRRPPDSTLSKMSRQVA